MSSRLALLAGVPPVDRPATMRLIVAPGAVIAALECSNFALEQDNDHVSGWPESNLQDQLGRLRMQIRRVA